MKRLRIDTLRHLARSLRFEKSLPKSLRKPKGWIINRVRERKMRAGALRVVGDALAWLDRREPTWGLKRPIDRTEYARALLAKMADAPRINPDALRLALYSSKPNQEAPDA